MSKVMGIYVKFTKTTHQIWSYHVTLASNSENFYFSPNFVLNFRKSYQIWGEIVSRTKKLQAKNKLGVENTPPVLGSKFQIHQFFLFLCFANEFEWFLQLYWWKRYHNKLSRPPLFSVI